MVQGKIEKSGRYRAGEVPASRSALRVPKELIHLARRKNSAIEIYATSDLGPSPYLECGQSEASAEEMALSILAIRASICAHSSMFSSRGSSDRSSI